MKGLISPLLELEQYNTIITQIKNKQSPVLCTGLIDVEKTHLAYSLMAHTKQPILIMTYNDIRAKQLQEDISFFHKNVIYYKAKDILFYTADVHSTEINHQRFLALNQILSKQADIIILSMEALLEPYIPKADFKKFILTLKVGEHFHIEDISKKLIYLGYEFVEQVEARGQFAIRGGILDIFSIIAQDATRIEFFDTEIESIKSMDILSQRSSESLSSIEIFPMQELVYTERLAKKAGVAIKEDLFQMQEALQAIQKEDIAKRLYHRIFEDASLLESEQYATNLDAFIHYFYPDTVSLLDYFPKSTLLFFDEPERIFASMETIQTEYDQSINGRMEEGFALPKQRFFLHSYTDILEKCSKFSQVLLSTMSEKTPSFAPLKTVTFLTKSSPVFHNQLELFIHELKDLQKSGYRIVILGGNTLRCERIVKELRSFELEAIFLETVDKNISKSGIVVTKGNLSKGFQYPEIKFALFSSEQMFAIKDTVKKKKNQSSHITTFTDLNVGDFVVHDNHGIGKYLGIEQIKIEGIQKDYMKITYADGGNLFVSTNQMEMVQKYIGSGSNAPKLNKLGGAEWEKAKSKTRAMVKLLAEDLVGLYAKRSVSKGFVYPSDTIWQREFEEAFPYTETKDQQIAIDDMKKDMESSKVMDRLICGDVGYGKTEVAIRGAFKAVQAGKQVAFLVPTTILAQQHFRTFMERMSSYPIQIELLSRFRTPKQQKASLENIRTGVCDIIIGTHRLLSKDVIFKDLGLMIVDEEQRFGVSHKEKMKRLQENVDVLTLSATPIPRTLHMSLSGIRDMSLLEEPPQERHPIQTYVMESNHTFIAEAIRRELSRDGQVYYLYNRVESIEEETHELRSLIPNANITYAHGRMPERELERIMEKFLNKEIDVLVCTTIIETGMDISNVNTIIIQDADYMGLSQLYQLRGRVGRSNRIAYAYLLYRRDKMLKEIAEKRLQTIREFTEFGAGFKIALRDLEIRGAGNLLGAEQHGHMITIGYDMYCRLLEEEILKLKGDPLPEKPVEINVDLNISAFIPESYIKNQQQRMEIYKKISMVRTDNEYEQIYEELEDRYGNLPKKVQTLLDIVLIKIMCANLKIISIIQKGKMIVITFQQNPNIKIENLMSLIQNMRKYSFSQTDSNCLTIKLDKSSSSYILAEIQSVLKTIS